MALAPGASAGRVTRTAPLRCRRRTPERRAGRVVPTSGLDRGPDEPTTLEQPVVPAARGPRAARGRGARGRRAPAPGAAIAALAGGPPSRRAGAAAVRRRGRRDGRGVPAPRRGIRRPCDREPPTADRHTTAEEPPVPTEVDEAPRAHPGHPARRATRPRGCTTHRRPPRAASDDGDDDVDGRRPPSRRRRGHGRCRRRGRRCRRRRRPRHGRRAGRRPGPAGRRQGLRAQPRHHPARAHRATSRRPAPLVPAEPLTKDESKLALGIVVGFVVLALVIGIYGRLADRLRHRLGVDAAPPPRPARRPWPRPRRPPRQPDGVGEPAGGAAEPLAILKVEAYDPEGDGEENNNLTPKIYDGDKGTGWFSENYRSDSFGGLKKGLGVIVDLGPNKKPQTVELDIPQRSRRRGLRRAGQPPRGRHEDRREGDGRRHGDLRRAGRRQRPVHRRVVHRALRRRRRQAPRLARRGRRHRLTPEPAMLDDLSALTDRELLQRHVDGDGGAAFGELFRRHRDRMYAVALRTTSNRELAADAVQDAFISAFRRADAFRGEAAVTTWLHRIVVNACLDRLRREKVSVRRAGRPRRARPARPARPPRVGRDPPRRARGPGPAARGPADGPGARRHARPAGRRGGPGARRGRGHREVALLPRPRGARGDARWARRGGRAAAAPRASPTRHPFQARRNRRGPRDVPPAARPLRPAPTRPRHHRPEGTSRRTS